MPTSQSRARNGQAENGIVTLGTQLAGPVSLDFNKCFKATLKDISSVGVICPSILSPPGRIEAIQ
jgi:hypothetical protein